MSAANRRWSERWAALHPAWKTAAAMTCLGVAVLLPAPWVLDVYRDWRAARNLQGAREALAAGEFLEARRLARQVLVADREGAEAALPVLARAADELGHPDVLAALTSMFQPDAPEKAGKSDLFWDMAVRRMPSGPLLGLWWSQSGEWRRRPEITILLAERLRDEGSRNMLRKVLATWDGPLPVRLEACRLHAMATSDEDWEQGEFVTAWMAALERYPDAAARWCELLPLVPRDLLLGSEARQVADAIGALKSPDARLAMWQALFLTLAEPARSREVIDGMISRYRADEPWELARMCMHAGRPSLISGWIRFDIPGPDAESLELQVRWLTDADRKEEAAALLEQAADARASGMESRLLRLRAAQLREDKISAANHGKEILEEARKSHRPESCLELALHAERMGLAELAREAWVDAFLRGTGPLPMVEAVPGLLKTAQDRRDEPMFLDLLERIEELEPTQTEARELLDHLNLTNGRISPEETLRKLAAHRSESTDAARPACTLMLAWLLGGHTDQARRYLDGLSIDWEAEPPALRAVRATVLRAGGGADDPAPAEALETMEGLFPSEIRVLSGLWEEQPQAPTSPAPAEGP